MKLTWIVMIFLLTSALVAAEYSIDDQYRVHRSVKHGGQIDAEMRFLVDELDRICELTDEQVAKLRVAAKGAVQKASEKQAAPEGAIKVRLAERENERQILLKRRVVLAQQRAEEAAAAAGQIATAEEERDKAAANAKIATELAARQQALARIALEQEAMAKARALEAQVVAIQLNDIRNGARPYSVNPANEQIWQDTVNRVLTVQQKGRLEESHRRREAFKKQTRVTRIVALIDEQLLLSNEQRTRFVEFIGRLLEVGPELADNLPTIVSQIPKEQIKPLVSESQRRKWDSLRGNRALRRFK